MSERSRRVKVWGTFKRVNREAGGLASAENMMSEVISKSMDRNNDLAGN